ncbi:MAG: S8 family serine peptidase [Nannocystaceae bacterium]
MADHQTQDNQRPNGSRKQTIACGVGLLAASIWLCQRHHHSDAGISAADINSPTFVEVVAAGGEARALLLDLVEPEDGEGGSEAELHALVTSIGLPTELAGAYAETEHLYRATGDVDTLRLLRARLEGHHLVEGVEPDLVFSIPRAVGTSATTSDDAAPGISRPTRPRVDPDDPMFKLQWHFEQIRVPEAWTHTRGEGAVVAVIDTGVAWKDLQWGSIAAKAVPDLRGVAFADAETFVDRAMPDGLDDHAHGTHVAGTIAQATDNGIGVAGVAHAATIMPLKVLDGSGRGSVAGIANAIRYAADHGAHVINMSLGGPLPSRVLAKAVEYAHDKGVAVVCAAGNEKRGRVSYPAAYKGAIAVAATNFEGTRSFYSNWGKQLDVSAPGGDTRADKNGDGHPDGVLQNTIAIQNPALNEYLWFQGTSMASPHVAGVAALIVSRGVNNPTEVERILKESAVHPNQVDWDKDYGAGIVDAAAALDIARDTYTGERLGIAGLLAFLMMGLLRTAGYASVLLAGPGRVRVGAVLGLGMGVSLVTGVFGSPLPYLAASALGLVGGASALLLSAATPVSAAALLLGVKPLRGLLVGLALGYAALLFHGALVLPTILTDLPGGTAWDRAWLAVNGFVSLLLARRVARGARV